MTNRNKVLDFVKAHPGHTQKEISEELGITPTTGQQVNPILRNLIKDGLITRDEQKMPYKYLPVSISFKTVTESQDVKANNDELPTDITRENTLIVVSCTKRKIWNKNPKEKEVYKPARDGYVGKHDWFQKWRVELEQKWKGSPWLILSAKYGFIEPEHPICNYNVTFKYPRTGPITKDSLRNQVRYQTRFFYGNERRLSEFKHVLVKSNVTKGKDTYVELTQAAFESIAYVRKLSDGLWNTVANLPKT